MVEIGRVHRYTTLPDRGGIIVPGVDRDGLTLTGQRDLYLQYWGVWYEPEPSPISLLFPHLVLPYVTVLFSGLESVHQFQVIDTRIVLVHTDGSAREIVRWGAFFSDLVPDTQSYRHWTRAMGTHYIGGNFPQTVAEAVSVVANVSTPRLDSSVLTRDLRNVGRVHDPDEQVMDELHRDEPVPGTRIPVDPLKTVERAILYVR